MELLHVYYHCIEDANDRNVGSWRLNGLKIIGDPNVPGMFTVLSNFMENYNTLSFVLANQLSFSIDVNDKVNVMNAIQEVTIYAFSIKYIHVVIGYFIRRTYESAFNSESIMSLIFSTSQPEHPIYLAGDAV